MRNLFSFMILVRSGKRSFNVVTMIGIGQTSVYSITQILSVIEVNEIVVEILFHVLPDSNLSHGIIIGRDILHQGVFVHMASDKLCFSKENFVFTCKTTGTKDLNLDLIDTDVSQDLRPILMDVLNSFRQNFVTGIPNTRANVTPMQIRLKDPCKTVCRRPYRLSTEERCVVRDRIEELLRCGIIRPSSSPFASPILLVKKKDGSDRMCVDYRELNDNTVPERFPLPLISDQIDRLNGCNFFTTLDMASVFHQIPIHSDSIGCTAFVTPDGQYEFLTMPFGLRNAPSVFQRAVVNALGIWLIHLLSFTWTIF